MVMIMTITAGKIMIINMMVALILVTLGTDDGWEDINSDVDNECYDHGEKNCDHDDDLF